MLSVSIVLTTVAACWEDHPDVSVIDHFLDFHVDYDRIVDDNRRDSQEQKHRQDQSDAFIREVYDYRDYEHDRGWHGQPDRDR